MPVDQLLERLLKLTATNIRMLDLPRGKKEHVEWDTEIPGFGLRLRETGARTLIFQYGRRGGGNKNKTPKIKIGTVGAIDFGKARKLAQNYYARVQLGEDPARDRAESQVRASETFGAIVARFLAYQRERLRPRTYPDVERHLLVHAKILHGLPLAKVERRDIAGVLSAVAENAGAVTSNRVRTSLSGFFAWAIREGLVDTNPALNTNKQLERPRDRVLTSSELRLIWTHAGASDYGAVLRLLMLTGARADEIASLRWSEVQDDVIVLPADRVKNHRPHEIPLTAAALDIIASRPRRFNADGQLRDLVFGSGEGGFSGWSKSKVQLDDAIAKAMGRLLPRWVPHDLRRSFSTHANELGIEPHIIEAVLGHVSGFRGGVAGVYNHARYRPQKRAALERWADQLMGWVEGRETGVKTQRQA
jgi:integrase